MDLRGLNLSTIGLGAFKIGRNVGIKYPQAYDIPDDREAERLLNTALDLGIRYMDTAPAYGFSEQRIGRFLNHRREEFLVSTKVGETFEDGVSRYDFSASAIRDSVHDSLRKLRRDVLDIVFVHAPHDDCRVLIETDVIATLQALRQQGLILNIGLSAYSPEAYRSARTWADAFMMEYHFENRELEPLMSEAADKGMAVVVKKGLASGRLDPDRAIRFIVSNRNVTSLLIGTLDAHHLQDALTIACEIRDAHANCS